MPGFVTRKKTEMNSHKLKLKRTRAAAERSSARQIFSFFFFFFFFLVASEMEEAVSSQCAHV